MSRNVTAWSSKRPDHRQDKPRAGTGLRELYDRLLSGEDVYPVAVRYGCHALTDPQYDHQRSTDITDALAELARLREDVHRLTGTSEIMQRMMSATFDRAEAADREVAQLRHALEFYADPISYAPTQIREPRTAVHGDDGCRARAALSPPLINHGDGGKS